MSFLIVVVACFLVASPLGAQAPSPIQVDEVLFSLGGLDRGAEEDFYRVANPFFSGRGRLVVPDAGSSEIRIFDRAGGLVTASGREGEGPGEYRSIARASRYRGDSIAVFDDRLQRITILSADGRRGRTLSLAERRGGIPRPRAAGARVSPRAFVVGVFGDGGFFLRRGEVSIGPGDTTAVRRDRFRYARIDPEGRHVGDLFTLPDDEQFVWAENGSRSVRPRAFARTTAVATAGERIFVADNDAFEVDVYEGNGDRAWTLGAERRPRPVEDADRRRWLERELGKLEDSMLRRVTERALRSMPFPDAMPVHGELVVGADGRVWLEEYRVPDAREPRVWTVFGTDGGVLERIAFPSGFRLTWAGAERALGVLTNELDVETVVAYRLPSGM